MHIRMQRGSDSICSPGESGAAAELHGFEFLQRRRRREILEDNRDAGIYVKKKKHTKKTSSLTLHNEIPSEEVARSLSGTVFRPQREFTSD